MAIVGSRITVNSTPTLLASGATGSVTDPVPAVIKNTTSNSVIVYIGGPNVAASGPETGYELEVGQGLSFQLLASDIVYGIVATGTSTVDVIVGRK